MGAEEVCVLHVCGYQEEDFLLEPGTTRPASYAASSSEGLEVPVNKVGLATQVAGSAGARNTVDQIRTNQSPFACTSDVT